MSNEKYREVGDFTRMAQLLRKKDLNPDEANELTELIGEMASTNLITRFESKFESKMDAQTAKMDALSNALNAKYNLLLWFLGTLVALGAFSFFANLLNLSL